MVGMMAQSSGLDVAVGGNLGTPMLDLLSDDRDLYVLELSSFQLELIEDMKGAIVCLLNVSADHMDRYDNLKEYAAAKHRIFNGASVAIFNREDYQTIPSAEVGVKSFNFALDTPDKDQFGINFTDKGKFLSFGANPLVEISNIPTQGKHNHMNARIHMVVLTLSRYVRYLNEGICTKAEELSFVRKIYTKLIFIRSIQSKVKRFDSYFS